MNWIVTGSGCWPTRFAATMALTTPSSGTSGSTFSSFTMDTQSPTEIRFVDLVLASIDVTPMRRRFGISESVSPRAPGGKSTVYVEVCFLTVYFFAEDFFTDFVVTAFFAFVDPFGRPRFLGGPVATALGAEAPFALFFDPTGRPRFFGFPADVALLAGLFFDPFGRPRFFGLPAFALLPPPCSPCSRSPSGGRGRAEDQRACAL